MSVKKGDKFYGPDGVQGYEALVDINIGDPVRINQMKAFGGAPEPQVDVAVPAWLMEAVEKALKDK